MAICVRSHWTWGRERGKDGYTMPQLLAKKRTSPLKQAQLATKVKLTSTAKQLNALEQQTLRAIIEADKYDYVVNDVFETKNAEKTVFIDAEEIPRPDTSWYHPVMDNLTAIKTIKNNTGTVLLTAAQERVIFTQFNYCRFKVCQLKAEVGNKPVGITKARTMLDWHRKAEAYRDQIAQTNLALVLAMAKRTRMSEVDFGDLVSEGNMALLRAVDKFDVARGFKFSTYACRAILKAFSRSGVKLSKYRQLFPTDFDPKLERSNYMEKKRASHEDDCVDEISTIMDENRAELTDIEQEVIEHRFALGQVREQNPEASPLTLEQVGRIIGVTKERVRQIQNKALDKIRSSLEQGYLD